MSYRGQRLENIVIMSGKALILSKPVMPVMIGLCLGITLSMICAPFLDETGCELDGFDNQVRDPKGRALRRTSSLNDNLNFDYSHEDDFEPRLVVEKPRAAPRAGKRTKRLRPRYASTELKTREKLFVGVITSRDSIVKLGVAVNKTLSHYVPKLVFFMDNRGPSVPSGMSIVSFSDEKPQLKPFYMLKYIGDHHLHVYDWFFFVPDNSYVRGLKLMKQLTETSISEDLHLGKPVDDPGEGYCNLQAGIVLSQSVVNKVVGSLEWCIQNAVSDDPSINFGQCIVHASGQACTDITAFYNYTHYSTPSLDRDDDLRYVTADPTFSSALTVHRVADDVTMYRIHRFFCQEELNQTRQELRKTQEDILKMAPLHPDGPNNITWPIGVDSTVRPKSRFEVIRWDYFTETHIYLDGDFSNMKELKGVHKLDVQDVLETAVLKLNKIYGNRLTFKRLVNGYRRFDPVRGMEYIVDIKLQEAGREREIQKRVHMIRPLNKVEIIPMPYVTENSRVNLILPVTADDREKVASFLDSYAHTCLDSGDNTHLFIVFIYDPLAGEKYKEDVFAVLKSMIMYYENRYMSGAHIAWMALESSNPSKYDILDAVSRKYPPVSLLMLCTVGLELSAELLNRVRMNTIAEWQVFFPMGFWQYRPNLIYTQMPYPTHIDISKNQGHFDPSLFEHASFYNLDYQLARKRMLAAKSSKQTDLVEMFVNYHKLHIFRALEPALKHSYKQHTCNPMLDEDGYQRCLASRLQGLASRSQLAMLIFQHQRKVDEEHMDVIHQQNQGKVEQMKPNMKK